MGNLGVLDLGNERTFVAQVIGVLGPACYLVVCVHADLFLSYAHLVLASSVLSAQAERSPKLGAMFTSAYTYLFFVLYHTRLGLERESVVLLKEYRLASAFRPVLTE